MLRRVWIVSLALPILLPAALLRIEVSERSDVLDGKPFGSAGPYERIIGKAYFAVDPNLPANKIITDIARAPRDENGQVGFSADLYCLKPRDPAHGNHAVLFEVSNRGGKGQLSMFNLGSGAIDPRDPSHFGDGFLLEQGYTLVWLGWEFDVPEKAGLLRLYTPVAKGITGIVRSEITLDHRATHASLGDRDQVPYPVLNPDDPHLKLTFREHADAPRRPVSRDAWHIEGGHVVMPAGFEPGRIYELVYESKDPPIVGLGPAAVRDLISFLKYGIDGDTILADHHDFIKRAYGFGISQSGRFLRAFLYYGFNQDEKGRRVFDGMFVHVAGGARGSFDHRFAQPSRDAHPFFNTFYPTDIFPFTDLPESDSDTGITDGLLSHATKPAAIPKIFYVNTSYEYYGRSASLIHTTIDGTRDAEIPETTRIYFLTGCQHGPAAFPPMRGETQNLPNPNNYRWNLRALLVALDSWVAQGKEPPPSQYPRIAKHELVDLSAVRFPKIDGLSFPTRIERAWHVNYGEEFRTAGIVTKEPPEVGRAFPTLVPAVNADGNDISGIRMPAIAVPLATYTGWNLRSSEIGAPDELYSMVGSFIPFARTKADRQKTRDPRLSIEERYSNKEDYLNKVRDCARRLAGQGYLLEHDIPLVEERASSEWDFVIR